MPYSSMVALLIRPQERAPLPKHGHLLSHRPQERASAHICTGCSPDSLPRRTVPYAQHPFDCMHPARPPTSIRKQIICLWQVCTAPVARPARMHWARHPAGRPPEHLVVRIQSQHAYARGHPGAAAMQPHCAYRGYGAHRQAPHTALDPEGAQARVAAARTAARVHSDSLPSRMTTMCTERSRSEGARAGAARLTR